MFTLTQDSMQSINICQITTEPYHSQIQDLANSIGSLKVTKDAGFFFTSTYVRELHMLKKPKAIKECQECKTVASFKMLTNTNFVAKRNA